MNTPTTHDDLDQVVNQLRAALGDVFSVESSTVTRNQPPAVVFRGKLVTDSDTAFEKIQPRFEALGFTPRMERMEGSDVVMAMPGIVRAQPSNPMINLV